MSADYNSRAAKETGYSVTDCGKIYSHKTNKFLSPGTDSKGYKQIRLNGKYYMVHRLVLETFRSECLPNMQCNHINGIKTDNRLENLEWCTGSENCQHANKTGLRNVKGTRNPMSKLTLKQIQEAKQLRKAGKKYHQIASKFNVSRHAISRAIRGVTYGR